MPQDKDTYNPEALTEQTVITLSEAQQSYCDPDMDDYHEFDWYHGVQAYSRLNPRTKSGLGLVFADLLQNTSNIIKEDANDTGQPKTEAELRQQQAFADGIAAAGVALKKMLGN